ncbi:MAG: DUF2141 domain-containing protein [Congregibacter sp.]
MTKKIFLATLGLIVSMPIVAQDLTLAITQIREARGVVYWSVYDSDKNFEAGESALASGGSRAAGDSLRITLHDLSPGNYAAKIYHDANENGDLDRNLIGLPTESYGFSNNAGSRGPASFEDAKIVLDGNTVMNIRMR